MQVDFGGGGHETEHALHLSHHAHHAHYDPQGQTGSSAYAPFRHPTVPAIDPGLDQSSGANRNGHAPMTSAHHHSNSQHLLTPDNASLGASHLSHPFYADMPRSSGTPSTPSNASPRFAAISPSSQPKQMTPGFVPNDRAPPSRDVSDSTIDEAYAAFILYCNPHFSTSTDTAELTKLFRMPPKSDGKLFSTYTLFELIRKLENKEIKTWTQLALDLGVEQPDTEKGQSTQKVQQYSVRLKRWMRAMHIDAFFEYLLGKQHPYYLNLPSPSHPFPENGRDGVPLEEDLAIRALDPKLKPKRGRRKADDGDEEESMVDNTPPRKRPQLDTSIPFGNVLPPQSAYPGSAHPDNMEGFLSAHDPWTASAITPSSAMTAASAPGRMNPNKNLTPYSASPMSGQQIRWRLGTQEPTTPHPLSAVTPHSAHPDFFDEPQSAVTPSSSKPRSRRRHGPAVSSAWSGNNTSSTGKLRGRPPSNRSVRDGPFVTFPANPNKKEGPTIEMNRNPGNLTPIVERAQSDPPVPEQHFRFPPTPASAISPTNMQASLPNSAGGRPHRLSLQVPENVGNPVRLVTPTVLVNGEQDPTPSTGLPPSSISSASQRDSPAHFLEDLRGQPDDGQSAHHAASGTSRTHNIPHPPIFPSEASPSAVSLPHVEAEALNRALATELIRAPLRGRRKRLRGTEAKNLASTILQPLYAKPTTGSAVPAKVMSDQILRIAISSCLGLSSAVGLGLGGPNGGVRRVECMRFRVGGDGYESPVEDDDEDADGMGATNVRETFDVSFGVSFGGLTGEWSAKGLRATGDGGTDATESPRTVNETEKPEQTPNTVAAWKSKFLEAQRKLWESQEEATGLREKILEAVL